MGWLGSPASVSTVLKLEVNFEDAPKPLSFFLTVDREFPRRIGFIISVSLSRLIDLE